MILQKGDRVVILKEPFSSYKKYDIGYFHKPSYSNSEEMSMIRINDTLYILFNKDFIPMSQVSETEKILWGLP